jgi:hypothetical protein
VTAEQLHGEHEQVIKIHRGIVAQGALIQGIDSGHRLIEAKIPGITQESVGIDQVILERTDTAHDCLWGIQLLVNLQLLGALFHQGELVSRIINHELGGEAERLGLTAQEAGAGSVKRTEPDGQPGNAKELMHPLTHFLRCLIGERHG